MAEDQYRRLSPSGVRLTQTRAEYLASHRNPAHYFKCEHCGIDAHRPLGGSSRRKGYRNRFCSQACRLAAHVAVQRAAAFSPLYPSECDVCGAGWLARYQAQRRCSKKCQAEHARRAGNERFAEMHRTAGRVVRCGECGASYCPLYGCKTSSTPLCVPCAAMRKRLQRRRAKGGKSHQQRAKRAGVERRYFNTLRIFERDRWTCQLCGVKTPQRLRGTREPNAPELDHIIPLAAGGPHTQENVQCACRACNLAKGATPRGQMLLSGFADTRVA